MVDRERGQPELLEDTMTFAAALSWRIAGSGLWTTIYLSGHFASR
jgi:hypothetical protein